MNGPEYSLSLDSVICRRCNTISRAEEDTCPACGADRQGAIFTSHADVAPAAAASATVTPEQLDVTDLRDTGWLTRMARRKMVTSYPSLAEPGDAGFEPPRKPARKGVAMLVTGAVAALAAGGYLYTQSGPGFAPAAISAAGAIRDNKSASDEPNDVRRAELARSRSVASEERSAPLASTSDLSRAKPAVTESASAAKPATPNKPNAPIVAQTVPDTHPAVRTPAEKPAQTAAIVAPPTPAPVATATIAATKPTPVMTTAIAATKPAETAPLKPAITQAPPPVQTATLAAASAKTPPVAVAPAAAKTETVAQAPARPTPFSAATAAAVTQAPAKPLDSRPAQSLAQGKVTPAAPAESRTVAAATATPAKTIEPAPLPKDKPAAPPVKLASIERPAAPNGIAKPKAIDADDPASPAVARSIAAVQQSLAVRDLGNARRHMRSLRASESRSPEIQQLSAELSRQERARDAALASARNCSFNRDASCAIRNARRAAAIDARSPQAQSAVRQAMAVQNEANTESFRQASAMPGAPVPSMTFDGRWSATHGHASSSSQSGDRSGYTLFGWGVPTVAKGRGDAH